MVLCPALVLFDILENLVIFTNYHTNRKKRISANFICNTVLLIYDIIVLYGILIHCTVIHCTGDSL